MWNWKKFIVFMLYFSLVGIIIAINSSLIVEWLNKSLFLEFAMDIDLDSVSDSFFKGTSFVFFIFLLFYAIFGTFIVGLIVTNLLFSGLVFANHVKVDQRNEFITFKELQTITSPKELLSLVDIPVTTALLIGFSIILILVMFHYLIKFASKRINFHLSIKTRLGILLIALVPLLFIFQQPNVFNNSFLKFEEANLHNWNPIARARKDGFLPTFFNTVNPDYMNKPPDYSKTTIEKVYEKYEHIAERINKDRHETLNESQTILYLSETLMDPMTFPNLIQNETPIPFISSMKEGQIGGTIHSQYIGGGTANIEWSLLTSFSLEVLNDPLATTPFSDFYAQSRNHHTFLDFFQKEKIALHPYSAKFYKRETIYNAIGFDDFLFLDNGIKHTEKLGTHIRVSDESFHKDLLRVASDENVGFIHALTMQNHSPYSGEIPDMKYIPEINLDVFPENKKDDLINYLQGLRASDEAVEQLIGEFEHSKKDINLVFFGDHLPNIFSGLDDQFTDNQLHETPWFIYMNNGRSVDGMNIDGLSPIFLTTVLLREGNYFVSPFQALMDELLSHGIKRIGKDYVVSVQGHVTDEDLDEDLLEMIHDYRNVVYDALFGSDWLPDEFFLDLKVQ